ncbi:hypothetical protein Q427_29725 [Halomonas sp. BC04]|nr:hypothetical protein Q427_29725 [Halomonas sp. BC04]
MPTTLKERAEGNAGIKDPVSLIQVQTLDDNCVEFGIEEFKINDPRQGIVHVVGPEQGATLPGMTVVCGDSHTATHGAFAALAHGIGTSEVEHVLATQCLLAQKMKNMQVRVEGKLGTGVTAKDVVLAIIGKIGTAGGTGYAIEFAGSAIRDLSMEGRMTVCNMAIEAGARVGLIAVDDTTIDYLGNRPFAPSGEQWEAAVADWRNLVSDADAEFDQVVTLDAAEIEPQVSWGTSPRWSPVFPVRCPTRPRPVTTPCSAATPVPWNTWASPRGRRSPISGSTRSSSAPAPIRGSRTCARPPRWPAARRSPAPFNWPWWCRAPAW